MRGIIGQTLALTAINLKALSARRGLVAATALCVALVVSTLLGLDALRQGLRATLEQSGAADVVIVMRGGSQSEINSLVTREQVDLIQSAPGAHEISPEVNLVVDGYRREDGRRANIGLRGLTTSGVALRHGVELLQGRWPALGSSELAIGRNIADAYRGMEFGAIVTVGTAKWTIVGVFEADGGVAESEIWADLTAVQSLFDRGDTVQSVRILVDDEDARHAIAAYSDADPRLQLSVQTEADYFAVQSARTTELAHKLAWPLATLMAIGAVVGALNTMQASVATRITEIATFRVMGFRRRAICAALVVECVLICLVAGLIGATAAYLSLDGLRASTLGGGITRIGYALEFTATGLLQGLGLAIVIGVLGAIVPAALGSLRPVTRILSR